MELRKTWLQRGSGIAFFVGLSIVVAFSQQTSLSAPEVLVQAKAKGLEWSTAASKFEQAIKLADQDGKPGIKAMCRFWYGRALQDRDQDGRAIVFLTEAASFDDAVHDAAGANTARAALGLSEARTGSIDDAVAHLVQSSIYFQSQSNKAGEAAALSNLGLAYEVSAKYSDALSTLERAHQLFDEQKDAAGASNALRLEGRCHQDLGEYAEAIKSFDASINGELTRLDPAARAHAVLDLIGCYFALNDLKSASALINVAEALSKQANDLPAEAAVWVDRGRLNQLSKRAPESLRNYEHALKIEQKCGSGQQPGTLNLIAIAYLEMKQAKEGEQAAKDAYASAVEFGDLRCMAQAIANRGIALFKLNQSKEALSYLAVASSIFEKIKDLPDGANTENAIMEVLAAGGDKNKALSIFFGKQAVATLQKIRVDLKALSPNTQKVYSNSVEKIYRRLAELLASSDRIPEALEVIRLLKAEEYSEFVHRGDSIPTGPPSTSAEIAWNVNLSEVRTPVAEVAFEFDHLKRTSSGFSDRAQQLLKALNEAAARFQTVISGLDKKSTDVAQDLNRLNTAISTQTTTVLSGLPLRTAAVFTVTGDAGLSLIVAMRGAKIYQSSPIPFTKLRDTIFAFRSALDDPTSDAKKEGKALYDLLVGPIATQLDGYKPEAIMWSLDGPLRYIPVAALWDGKQYLVEKYRLSVFAPDLLGNIRTHDGADWVAAGFGVTTALAPIVDGKSYSFPELYGVLPELQAVLASCKSLGPPILDKQFTHDALLSAFSKAGVIHIASHCAFDAAGSPFLLLGQGVMSIKEFSGLSEGNYEGVKLVVLSACQTAVNQGQGMGSEFESLGSLIERSGAECVIASLWNVEDDSTRILMQRFYETHSSHPDWDRAECFRTAQLALLQGTATDGISKPRSVTPTKHPNLPGAKISNPHFWAPFVMMGNWTN